MKNQFKSFSENLKILKTVWHIPNTPQQRDLSLLYRLRRCAVRTSPHSVVPFHLAVQVPLPFARRARRIIDTEFGRACGQS